MSHFKSIVHLMVLMSQLGGVRCKFGKGCFQAFCVVENPNSYVTIQKKIRQVSGIPLLCKVRVVLEGKFSTRWCKEIVMWHRFFRFMILKLNMEIKWKQTWHWNINEIVYKIIKCNEYSFQLTLKHDKWN